MTSSSGQINSNRFQGIEYLWDAVKSDGQNIHEAALALIHWMLIGNGYRCIGHQNEFPTQEVATRVGSERLPENWNDRSAGFYSLLYIHPNHPNNMYLIKLIPAASIKDDIIMGQILIFSSAEDVIPFELNSRKFIPDTWKSAATPTIFPEFNEFVEFVDDIIGRIQMKHKIQGASASSNRDSSQTSSTPFFRQMQPPPSRPIPFVPESGPPLREFVPPGSRNPFGLGSRDLDPFSGMGGNIMGPGNFHPGGFPGAGPVRPYRYDPIVPPDFAPHGGIGGPRPPFRGDPSGFDPSFFGRGNPPGGVFTPGFGMGGLPRPAPLQPGEPDPDHERPPPPSGDDLDNMFM